jgi:arylsulfatase A-like enzyme
LVGAPRDGAHAKLMKSSKLSGVALAAAISAALGGCGGGPSKPEAPRPNVLWIVWDTVRADRLGVYGYERPTTPNLDAWSKDARVFEDCISPGSWTVPSHASMFTGLLPSEHGAEHESETLSSELDTIAELLQRSGYQTFAWTANPHISRDENATQGFEVERHPWDDATATRAREVFSAKLATFPETSEIRRRGEREKNSPWVLKAAGELAQEGLVEWLGKRDAKRPYFAFLNYMEAHRPLISPRPFREQVMTPEEVEASYDSEIDWPATWGYCFDLVDVPERDLELLGRSYDAGIRELDDLFGKLMGALEASGALENTIVVLTADHGEHLTEHHLLDHQYSVAQVLVRVPLIVRYPARFAPGRDPRPVMSMDLFPTLLELAGAEAPRVGVGHARSLLDPAAQRSRIVQYTKPFLRPLMSARKEFPDADLSFRERGLVAVVERPWKLVQEIGGPARLFDLDADPYETRDLATEQPETLERLRKRLAGVMKSLRPVGAREVRARSAEIEAMLAEFGY